jgi:hypothetical protein
MHHHRIIIFFCALIIGIAIITNRWIMEKYYTAVGWLFFRRLQDWERRKKSQVMTLVAAFCVVVAVVIYEIIKLIYSHTR